MRMPDETSASITAPGLIVRRGGPRGLNLSGAAVESAMNVEHRRELVDRLFSIRTLSRLTMDPAAGQARLQFEPGAGKPAELLRHVAQAMRAAKLEHFALADLALVEVLAPNRRIEISRAGSRLTFLRISPTRTGRRRFFHPEFRNTSARTAILSRLMGVAYLKRQLGSPWLGGFIEVEFEEGRMTLESLVDTIESALLGTIASTSGRAHWQPIHFRRHLVDTNLALAVLSDFVLPPARILSVMSLWLLNVRHARPTLRSLREWRIDNLDVLYSSIALLTLISMSFIASAVMYWMFEFWPRRVKKLKEAEMEKFLSGLKRCPRSVWVERDGTEMEMPLQQLRIGDTVILREGDIAPGDGRATSGQVMVAESWTAGLHRKKTGDIIHCSGRIASGEARIQIETLGTGAATSTLAEWHAESMLAPVSRDRVKRMATSAVIPALALAALAFFRNGVSMAKCMARPDYVTGPFIARDLGWVASVMEAARSGILIRNETALETLAQCDCFIFSPEVSWRPGSLQPREIEQTLKELGVMEILMPTGGMTGRTLSTVEKGVGESRPVDAGGLIKERQYLGRKVAFVGDCESFPDAAAQADISVHVCHPPFDTAPPAPIALFAPELQGVLALRSIATGYNDRLRGSFATALIPNVACIVGALYFNLPILGVVALTNAGTFASYLQGERALRAAASGRGGILTV